VLLSGFFTLPLCLCALALKLDTAFLLACFVFFETSFMLSLSLFTLSLCLRALAFELDASFFLSCFLLPKIKLVFPLLFLVASSNLFFTLLELPVGFLAFLLEAACVFLG
jgi:hypothetical protein